MYAFCGLCYGSFHDAGILLVLFALHLHMAFYDQEYPPDRTFLEGIMSMARCLPTVALSWGLTHAMWLASLNDLCHLKNGVDFIQVCSLWTL